MLLPIINCCLTALGPLYVFYKGTILSETTGINVLCTISTFTYFLARCCQILLLVTLSPDGVESMWLLDNFLGALTSIVDIFAIQFLMKTKMFTSYDLTTRLLAIGLGWSAAHALNHHLVWFILESRKAEFGLAFIQRALTSNLTSIAYLALPTLVYLWSRPHITKKRWMYLTSFMIFLQSGIPFLVSCINSMEFSNKNSWLPLALQSILVIPSSLITRSLHEKHLSDKKHH